jgi:enoyl-CoA hydratase
MSEVELQIRERVAALTINRPGARNAIGLATIDELNLALDRVVQSDAEVVLLSGAGDRAFVSGGDLKELGKIRDYAGITSMAVRMRRLLDRIATLEVPVIACLNGHALGGGAEVAVAADMRVAADDVEIGFTQVTLGIMPAWGGAERLAEIVGRSRALRLLVGGVRLKALEAAEIGLLDLVVPRSELLQASADLAARFTAAAPGVVKGIKAVVAAAKPSSHPNLEAVAVDHFGRSWIADAHWAAVDRAMGSKR